MSGKAQTRPSAGSSNDHFQDVLEISPLRPAPPGLPFLRRAAQKPAPDCFLELAQDLEDVVVEVPATGTPGEGLEHSSIGP